MNFQWIELFNYFNIYQGQAASVITLSKKKIKNIGIFVKDEGDEDEEEEKENEPKSEPILGRGKRTAVLDSKLRVCYFFYLFKQLLFIELNSSDVMISFLNKF